MKNTIYFLILIFLVMVIGGGAYLFLLKDDESTSDGASSTSEVSQLPDTETEQDNRFDYVIDMSNHSFSVNEIIAEAGDTLTIQLNNEEGIHDFVLDELDVNSGNVPAGSQKTITITIPEDASGESYEYYCSVSNHRALGMKGTLTVN